MHRDDLGIEPLEFLLRNARLRKCRGKPLYLEANGFNLIQSIFHTVIQILKNQLAQHQV